MPRSGKPAPERDPVERIRELASLLDEYRLTALAASWSDVSIRLERSLPPAGGLPAPLSAPGSAAAPETAPSPSPVLTIESPMVGTFYRASSPNAEPFVREGDRIKAGQILCIIEAMKLMNEIEAKVDGQILKILVDNATAVEYGQPLFRLEPLA